MPVAPRSAVFPPLQARNLNGRTLALRTDFWRSEGEYTADKGAALEAVLHPQIVERKA